MPEAIETQKPLWKSVTFYSGISAIVTGIGMIVTTGQVTSDAIEMIWGGFTAIFVRKALIKK